MPEEFKQDLTKDSVQYTAIEKHIKGITSRGTRNFLRAAYGNNTKDAVKLLANYNWRHVRDTTLILITAALLHIAEQEAAKNPGGDVAKMLSDTTFEGNIKKLFIAMAKGSKTSVQTAAQNCNLEELFKNVLQEGDMLSKAVPSWMKYKEHLYKITPWKHSVNAVVDRIKPALKLTLQGKLYNPFKNNLLLGEAEDDHDRGTGTGNLVGEGIPEDIRSKLFAADAPLLQIGKDKYVSMYLYGNSEDGEPRDDNRNQSAKINHNGLNAYYSYGTYDDGSFFRYVGFTAYQVRLLMQRKKLNTEKKLENFMIKYLNSLFKKIDKDLESAIAPTRKSLKSSKTKGVQDVVDIRIVDAEDFLNGTDTDKYYLPPEFSTPLSIRYSYQPSKKEAWAVAEFNRDELIMHLYGEATKGTFKKDVDESVQAVRSFIREEDYAASGDDYQQTSDTTYEEDSTASEPTPEQLQDMAFDELKQYNDSYFKSFMYGDDNKVEITFAEGGIRLGTYYPGSYLSLGKIHDIDVLIDTVHYNTDTEAQLVCQFLFDENSVLLKLMDWYKNQRPEPVKNALKETVDELVEALKKKLPEILGVTSSSVNQLDDLLKTLDMSGGSAGASTQTPQPAKVDEEPPEPEPTVIEDDEGNHINPLYEGKKGDDDGQDGDDVDPDAPSSKFVEKFKKNLKTKTIPLFKEVLGTDLQLKEDDFNQWFIPKKVFDYLANKFGFKIPAQYTDILKYESLGNTPLGNLAGISKSLMASLKPSDPTNELNWLITSTNLLSVIFDGNKLSKSDEDGLKEDYNKSLRIVPKIKEHSFVKELLGNRDLADKLKQANRTIDDLFTPLLAPQELKGVVSGLLYAVLQYTPDAKEQLALKNKFQTFCGDVDKMLEGKS